MSERRDTERTRFLDRCSDNPDATALEKQEQALFMAAKSGSLFEADMSPEEWEKFLVAAEIEETERKAGTPEKLSRLTEEQREVLESVSIPKSKSAQKVLTKREELIERARPQCVDADYSEQADEAAKDVKKEFGMERQDWAFIDTTLGKQ